MSSNRKTFLAGHDASYWILVFLKIFPLVHILDATQCPTTRLSWEKRAKALPCDMNQGFVYHCILDDSGRLVETCATRVPVPQGKAGCPRIHMINKEAYHMDDNSECPTGNEYCPSGKNAYYTDQLYLYPICFLPESERLNYTQESYEDSTEKTDTSTKVMPQDTFPAAIIMIILGILFTVLIALTLLYFSKCRRKNYKERDACTEQFNGIGPGDGESCQINAL